MPRQTKIENWRRIDMDKLVAVKPGSPEAKAWKGLKDARAHLEEVMAKNKAVQALAPDTDGEWTPKFSYNFGGFSVGFINAEDVGTTGKGMVDITKG